MVLSRALDGVLVAESRAGARMSSDDQSTFETSHWPAIPSAVVAAAKAFRDRLAEPTALAEYRA